MKGKELVPVGSLGVEEGESEGVEQADASIAVCHSKHICVCTEGNAFRNHPVLVLHTQLQLRFHWSNVMHECVGVKA